MRRLIFLSPLPFLLFGALMISCNSGETLPVMNEGEAALAARQIRREGIKPEERLEELFRKNSQVVLADYPGYSRGTDLLKYLLPFLYDQGIVTLDLWFIPDDSLVQANALLNASRFFDSSAAELMGRESYLYHYEENLDLLRYIFDFNKTLSPGERGFVLANGEDAGEDTLLLCFTEDPQFGGDSPLLLVQSPRALEKAEEDGLGGLDAKMNQLAPLLNTEDNLFVLTEESLLYADASPLPYDLIFLGPLEGNGICTPLDDSITRENSLEALKDFPEIGTKSAGLAAFLIRREQRRYLRSL